MSELSDAMYSGTSTFRNCTFGAPVAAMYFFQSKPGVSACS